MVCVKVQGMLSREVQGASRGRAAIDAPTAAWPRAPASALRRAAAASLTGIAPHLGSLPCAASAQRKKGRDVQARRQRRECRAAAAAAGRRHRTARAPACTLSAGACTIQRTFFSMHQDAQQPCSAALAASLAHLSLLSLRVVNVPNSQCRGSCDGPKGRNGLGAHALRVKSRLGATCRVLHRACRLLLALWKWKCRAHSRKAPFSKSLVLC